VAGVVDADARHFLVVELNETKIVASLRNRAAGAAGLCVNGVTE